MSIARTVAAWASASTSQKGPIELATQAEVDAGDATRAITPSTLAGTSLAFAGKFLGEEVFESTGTWTKPAGCTKIEVLCVGGGGGGAGVGTSSATVWGMGGGGGGGGKHYCFFDATNFGATVPVAVGAAGAGGAAGNNAGGSAGTSSFNGTSGSYYCYAAGGTGGGIVSGGDDWGANGIGVVGLSAGYLARIRATGETGVYGFVGAGIFSGSAGGGAPGSQGISLADIVPLTSGGGLGGSPSANSNGCGGGGAVIKDSIQTRAGSNGIAGLVIVKAYG